MVELTKLHQDDLSKLTVLAELYREAHPSLDFKADYKDVFIKYFEGLIKDETKIAITAKTSEGEIAGMIVGTVDDNSRLMLPEKIGYVPFLTVVDRYRRHGIGRLLLAELDSWFKEHGITLVELYTAIDNDDAKWFWGSNGYKVYLERRSKKI